LVAVSSKWVIFNSRKEDDSRGEEFFCGFEIAEKGENQINENGYGGPGNFR
jgi:hypothetical protein